MKSVEELRKEQKAIERIIEQRQRTAIDNILYKLFELPIARNDKHYDFLKEITEDLKKYEKEFL